MHEYVTVVPVSFSEVGFHAISHLTWDESPEGKDSDALTLHIREVLDELTSRRRPPRETTVILDILFIDFATPYVLAQPHGETGTVRIEQRDESIVLFSTNPLISD